ncbi:MAG TPA: hypothetical protein VG501_10940 [Rhizomicrobium sp.]|nr:hypothetical protein [Rhizomicrobium sp.]
MSSDKGYYHLTPKGWVRQDNLPYPDDRVETWLYEMECPAEDAKDQVCLTRVWFNPAWGARARDGLRSQFGEPLMATPERNVTLECLV